MKGLLLDFWSEFDFLFKNFTTFLLMMQAERERRVGSS